MSWIDDELNSEREAARQSVEKAQLDSERELHRAKLITSKGREIWDSLKAQCREQAAEFTIAPKKYTPQYALPNELPLPSIPRKPLIRFGIRVVSAVGIEPTT